MFAFEGMFLLAGVVLPLALVHRWGLIWPRWVLGLAGRKVPRWLVLGPAFAVGGAMTLYFGIGLGFTAHEAVTGTAESDSDSAYGPAFLWTAMSGYVVWGLGLFIAAIARFRNTRPVCRSCGA